MTKARRSRARDLPSIRLFAFACVVMVVGLGWSMLSPTFTMGAIAENGESLRLAVHDHLPLAIGLGSLVYVLLSLIPGTTGKAIVYGWLFGFWTAMAIVSISLTIAATLSMVTVRRFFQDWATRKAPRTIARINAALRRGGEATCLLMLRVLHSPFTLTNYSAGTTQVRLTTFAWTTLVGMIPSNLIFVMAGSRLPTLDNLSTMSIWTIVDWRLLLVGSLAIIIPTFLRRFTSTPGGQHGSSDGKACDVSRAQQ